jgi:hypothetical protein
MSTNDTWRELYRAALLELRPELLRQKIEVAETALRQRMAEIGENNSSWGDERQALDDALHGLRILVRTECSPRLMASGLIQSEELS